MASSAQAMTSALSQDKYDELMNNTSAVAQLLAAVPTQPANIQAAVDAAQAQVTQPAGVSLPPDPDDDLMDIAGFAGVENMDDAQIVRAVRAEALKRKTKDKQSKDKTSKSKWDLKV